MGRLRASLYERSTGAGLAFFGEAQGDAGLGPSHSHLPMGGFEMVVAVDVAAEGDGLTRFSMVENVVTDANLHACGAPAAGWPIMLQI